MSTSQVTISVVVDEETQRWLKATAERLDRSVSSVVRTIISEYREKQEKLLPPTYFPLPGNDY
ncbi:MAG: hypothetical protein KJ077_05910 [Anaerolineae bacterium]|nr:hypothetical protein [Anaerolineae bacterium]